MAYTRRSYSEIAVETTLSAGINASVEAFSIAASTGWPTGASGNFYALIEGETIDCESRSGTAITVETGGRGALGSSAATHATGVAVTLVFTSGDADEANYTAAETVGKITGAGQLLIGDGANSLAVLDAKTSGRLLIGNGTTLASVAMSGDATIDSAGALSLVANSVGSSEIAADAVGTSELAADAVGTSELADNAVDAGAIAANAVTTAKILDANVTLAKLANIATDKLIGRDTASSGVPEEIGTDGSTLEFSGSGTIRVKDAGITQAKMASSLRVPVTCTSGTRPGSPAEGDIIYETDTDRLLTYTTATTTWKQPWNMPWGNLYMAQSTAATVIASGLTSEDDIFNSSSLTIPAGRRIRVSCRFTAKTTDPVYTITQIRRTNQSGTVLARAQSPLMEVAAFGAEGAIVIDCVDTAASGATVYCVTFESTAATDVYNPYCFTVDDIGPNAAPA